MSLPANHRSAPPPPAPAGRPLRLTAPVETLGSAVLQVVAVWRGRIVGYRLLMRRRKVTIGSHVRATFNTPRTDGRKRYALLNPRRGGGYTLRLPPNLPGQGQTGAEPRAVGAGLAEPPPR